MAVFFLKDDAVGLGTGRGHNAELRFASSIHPSTKPHQWKGTPPPLRVCREGHGAFAVTLLRAPSTFMVDPRFEHTCPCSSAAVDQSFSGIISQWGPQNHSWAHQREARIRNSVGKASDGPVV